MPDKTDIEKYLLRMGWLTYKEVWSRHGSDDSYKIEEAHRIQSALDDTEDRRVWVNAYCAVSSAHDRTLQRDEETEANRALFEFRECFPRVRWYES